MMANNPYQDPCLVGVVSRLVGQKGIDLIIDAVSPYILDGRMQLVVLGSGEPRYEAALRQLQGQHPDDVCFWHGYNEALSHQIEAGCDLFLMPSRFEPCGLNQLYSLRYGTLPLVRHTGGLADTVIDVSSGEGNGFSFGPIDLGHFSAALDRALGIISILSQRMESSNETRHANRPQLGLNNRSAICRSLPTIDHLSPKNELPRNLSIPHQGAKRFTSYRLNNILSFSKIIR